MLLMVIALGGALGAVARYGISGWVAGVDEHRLSPGYSGGECHGFFSSGPLSLPPGKHRSYHGNAFLRNHRFSGRVYDLQHLLPTKRWSSSRVENGPGAGSM